MKQSFVDIVFDGPPGPEAPRFIEVEDSTGKSISLGEWIQRGPADKFCEFWALRIPDPRTNSKSGKQTWWGSIVEAKTNIAIGFVVAYFANLLILPFFGLTGNNPVKNFWITCMFTLVSIIRQLIIRRWFNSMSRGHHK